MSESPLSGRRIVVTRAAEQSSETLRQLQALGAEAVALPTIVIAPPEDWALLDRALAALDAYSGLIFTSTNAVAGFFARSSRAPSRPPRQWLCAIGPATAAALAQHPGWQPDIVPATAIAEGVVAALEGLPLAGSRILLPRAAAGRDLIPQALARRCATVEVVPTHRTLIPLETQPQARAAVAGADAILFTSSSTARNLAELLGPDYRQRLQGAALASLGPITSQTLTTLGLPVAVESPQPTIPSLIATLAQYMSGSRAARPVHH